MQHLDDLYIHWELDVLTVVPSPPPGTISGFFTLVIPFLESLLSHDTLRRIGIEVTVRCSSIARLNDSEKSMLAAELDKAFERHAGTMTKLRSVTVKINHECRASECTNYSGPFEYLRSNKQWDFRYVHQRFTEIEEVELWKLAC